MRRPADQPQHRDLHLAADRDALTMSVSSSTPVSGERHRKQCAQATGGDERPEALMTLRLPSHNGAEYDRAPCNHAPGRKPVVEQREARYVSAATCSMLRISERSGRAHSHRLSPPFQCDHQLKSRRRTPNPSMPGSSSTRAPKTPPRAWHGPCGRLAQPGRSRRHRGPRMVQD